MATVIFYGDAEAIKDVWTVTPASVGIGNTFTVTINGKDITVTATAATVANVTELLAEAINSNENGIPEFNEVVSVDNTTLVTVTARDGGIPIGLSSSASGGSATNVSANTTAATGPWHFDNADNYEGNTAPSNTDTVVHRRGHIRYALDQSSLSLAAFIKEKGSGEIGLPEQNNLGYDEYRDTYLTFSACTSLELDDDAPRVKINTGTSGACTAIVRSDGRREDPDIPAVLLKGAHASNVLNLLKGDVGVAFYEGETANWPTVNSGYLEDQGGDVQAVFGSGLSTVTAFKQNGGIVEAHMPVTTLTQFDGQFTRVAGAHGTVQVNGGNFIDRSDAAISTMLRVATGGVADFSRDLRGLTIAACELFAGGTILDPNSRATWSAGIDLMHCRLADVILEVGDNRNLAITAA